MANFTITRPDHKIKFFKELMDSLEFVQYESLDEFKVDESHRKILDERLRNYQQSPESPKIWDKRKGE